MKKDDETKLIRKANTYEFREEWMRAATNEVRPYFEMFGYTLPTNIRFAIAFTSGGKRGLEGECWNALASSDKHFEIIIKADRSDAVEILIILMRELIRTLLPPNVKYGREFREIAHRLGFEGKMVHAVPSPPLLERLKVIAANLGNLPHATLNFMTSNRKKKQGARMLKAECSASCGYNVRLLPKWAKVGLPVCPVNHEHGNLLCQLPEEDGEEGNIISSAQISLAEPPCPPLIEGR